MKTVGIIAEFNPFHNGHKYIIDQAKEKSGADKVIVIMSGAFTQRGTPAYMYKYDRTEYALKNGADLVLELPVSYSSATAETFAFGGVSILDSIGITDCLCFGSEAGCTDTLVSLARELEVPGKDRQSIILQGLSAGLSYPAARSKAYSQYSNILNEPNNILALEYLKAINKLSSHIQPLSVKRIGSGYHDTGINPLASADGIRNLFADVINSGVCVNDRFDKLKQAVPDSVLPSMQNNYQKTWPVSTDDFDAVIYSALLQNSADELSLFQDMNIDIANRFKNQLVNYQTASAFIADAKTKEVTYSRLSRALIHCMLHLEDLTHNATGALLRCPYTRILGFRKESSELLHAMQKSTTIPVITKAADAGKLLDAEGLNLFNRTLQADRIYDFILLKKYGTHHKDGCLISPVII